MDICVSATKLYPSTPVEPLTAERKSLEKKKNDIISFKKSNINLKEIVAYCIYENCKSKKKKKIHFLSTLFSKMTLLFLWPQFQLPLHYLLLDLY